ncbi:unnamed protein product [Sphenostylis stenocarpa]|uniref:Protein kinase domain-containing protein n=1 Tax=Sphenostylis stenocarpa TaxID=92480 RepID=A0AA86SIR3_9FABA|nr:unnamed protein product [Sphenostylis stenocarpa]
MRLASTKASIHKWGGGNGLVAVAVEKDDKRSRNAVKWAADTLLSRGQILVLIHVLYPTSSSLSRGSQAIVCNTNCPTASPQRDKLVNITKELFCTFHCYCTRKDIQCLDVVIEDMDIVRGITEYVSHAAIEHLVLGAASKHGFIRFKSSSTPNSILKGVPDFCSVYIISKGKISSVRNAARKASHASPLLRHIETQNDENGNESDVSSRRLSFKDTRVALRQSTWQGESMKKFGLSGRSGIDYAESDTDISFVSSGRPSSVRSTSVFYEYGDHGRNSRTSTSSDRSMGSTWMKLKHTDPNSPDLSFSEESSRSSFSSSLQNIDEVEADMRRLKLELKQTMEMYSAACKEALTAQQKLGEMHSWKMEEEKKLEEARLSHEAADAIAGKEKGRSNLARETAEATKTIARMETNKRAETLENVAEIDNGYRTYTMEEIEKATNMFSESQKIGEGGYGPVYRCYLDNTEVAVKVLRPGSAQGKSQFQQEVNILGSMRHPNMVLLVGACPEEGVLIYEYMANGSLEECLFREEEEAMGWELRFKIAAEIAAGLLFLHQTKPEPLVHRDLKPANILLDHNYVSKISDVGLARLVPEAVAENVTQCRMTAAAGTFCYIDPEYQQTGMLGVKSDVYSLGIILLQLLTGRRAMGLAHLVDESIQHDSFSQILDPSVPDWPLPQALSLANLALHCAQLRRRDRPDLATVLLPHLQLLRDFALHRHHHSSQDQDVLSEPMSQHSGTPSTPSTPTTDQPKQDPGADDE